MSDLGFLVESKGDFEALALQALEHGTEFQTESGLYVRWSPGAAVELWMQLDADGDVVGLNPHYAGRTRMRVGLTARVPRPESSILDGAFHGWADPPDGEPESGAYPFLFDVPDYELTGAVVVPSICAVQLTAFAHELKAYESAEAYDAAQTSKVKFAAESFIPAGLFNAGTGAATEPPQAHAILTGRVLDTALITNPASEREFCWAHVRTLGGELDMVADPDLLAGYLTKGGIVSGSFWLSGRVLAAREPAPDNGNS
ncbi:MAG: hypothetical protein ACJ74W_08445 [Pyrinomonadaceae bacterium]